MIYVHKRKQPRLSSSLEKELEFVGDSSGFCTNTTTHVLTSRYTIDINNRNLVRIFRELSIFLPIIVPFAEHVAPVDYSLDEVCSRDVLRSGRMRKIVSPILFTTSNWAPFSGKKTIDILKRFVAVVAVRALIGNVVVSD